MDFLGFFFNTIAAKRDLMVCWAMTARCRAADAWPSPLPGLIQPLGAVVGKGGFSGAAPLVGLRTTGSSNLFPRLSRIWNRMFACNSSIKNYGLLVNGFSSLRTLAHVSQGDAEQVFTTAAASPRKVDHLKCCGFAVGQILKHSEAWSG